MRINPPVDPLFRVGEIGLGYDKDRDRVVIFTKELLTEEEEPESAAQIRFWATREPDAQAGALGRGCCQSRTSYLSAVRPADGTRRSLLPEEERAFALKRQSRLFT